MIEFWQDKPLKDYDSVSLAGILREYFIKEYPAHYTQKLDNAIQIASYLHRYDVRRGKRGKLPNPPYIEHPLRVAVRMFKYFGVRDPYMLLAAVLHDTVEDHPFEFSAFYGVVASSDVEQARSRALAFISSSVGFECATIVKDVSNPVVPKGISKAEKISQYQEHVENIIKVSSSALLLKLSDFVDNAGSLHHHYDYNDKDVVYFLDRYEPLIPIYREAVTGRVQFLYDEDLVLDRLAGVEKEFQKFRTGTVDKETKTA